MKFIREFFGLSQHHISEVLKISRSHFSMIEDNKRSSSIQLESLYQRLITAYGYTINTNQSNSKESVLKPGLTDEIENKIKDRVIQKQVLMKRLDKMKKSYEPCSLWAEGIVQWKKIALPEDKNLIRLSEVELWKLESKCNRAEQLYLEMQIKGIDAELNFITENMEVPEDLIPAFLK